MLRRPRRQFFIGGHGGAEDGKCGRALGTRIMAAGSQLGMEAQSAPAARRRRHSHRLAEDILKCDDAPRLRSLCSCRRRPRLMKASNEMCRRYLVHCGHHVQARLAGGKSLHCCFMAMSLAFSG